MNLLTILSNLEDNDNLHLGRILVLLSAFSGQDGGEKIEGLTKLAKLDFLLRYPEYLERALVAKHASTKKLIISNHERGTIESSMIRYRFGPWDFRYRRFLNILAAKDLIKIETAGKTISISITYSGLGLVKE